MANNKRIFISEEEKLKKKLNRSYSERFHLLMKLIRINKMLKRAIIIPAPKLNGQ